jgi:hypothetical protein
MEVDDEVSQPTIMSVAFEGEADEAWDTQYCRRLQEEILSVRLSYPDEAAHSHFTTPLQIN